MFSLCKPLLSLAVHLQPLPENTSCETYIPSPAPKVVSVIRRSRRPFSSLSRPSSSRSCCMALVRGSCWLRL